MKTDRTEKQPPKGRPSSYTQAIGDEICERIAGGESLRGICKSDHLPDAATVFRWLAHQDEKYASFREQYARAREIQADALVDEILEISDDASNDWMERHDKDGQSLGWQLNGDHVQRSRLRVDSRKWFASKVAPKRYGDRIQQDFGTNGEAFMGLLAVAVTTLHQKLEKLGELNGEKDSELSSGRNTRQIASGAWDSGGQEDTGQTINGGYKVVQ